MCDPRTSSGLIVNKRNMLEWSVHHTIVTFFGLNSISNVHSNNITRADSSNNTSVDCLSNSDPNTGQGPRSSIIQSFGINIVMTVCSSNNWSLRICINGISLNVANANILAPFSDPSIYLRTIQSTYPSTITNNNSSFVTTTSSDPSVNSSVI